MLFLQFKCHVMMDKFYTWPYFFETADAKVNLCKIFRCTLLSSNTVKLMRFQDS